MNKFNVGEVVIYQNGERFELGEVKEVIEYEDTFKKHQRQDGLFGDPTGEYTTEIKYKYRVWYHTGDTTALTDERLLHKIINLYAFDIKRKRVD